MSNDHYDEQVVQRVEQIRFDIKEALLNEDLEKVDKLFKRELTIYLNSGYNHVVLQIIHEIEPLYKKKGEHLLAEFYCIKGHVYMFAEKKGLANACYQLAISYGMKFEKYGTVAAAMNNVVLMSNPTMDSASHLNLAKSVPLIYMSTKNFTNSKLLNRLLVYIEALIHINDFDMASRGLHFVSANSQVAVGSRVWKHLLLIEASIYEKKGQFQLAYEIYKKCLTENTALYSDVDLIEAVIGGLLRMSQFADSVHESIENDEFLSPLRQIELNTIHNLEKARSVKDHLAHLPIEKSYHDFLKKSNTLIEKHRELPFLIVVVQIYKLSSGQNNTVIEKNYKKMEILLEGCLYEIGINANTTLYYVISNPTEEIRQCIKQQSIALPEANTFITVVDSTMHTIQSVEEGIRIAQALLYYQNYK